MQTLINIYIFYFILVFIFFYIINSYILNNNIENFNNNIIFLDNNELLNILLKNDDKYYNTFFHNDFSARNIKNIDEYKNLIKKSVNNFNDKQKIKIKKCINEADLYFSKLNSYWLNTTNIINIQWIIGCIKGKYYENGLPHTRNNVIIISSEKVNNYDEKKLTKLFIHEKIHVYQKKYINDVNIYLKKNNFIKIKEREYNDNIRANPDLDNWIYKDNKENIYRAVYNKNPNSIEDITYFPKNNQFYEHPYEKMAIEIENKYK